MDKVISNSKYRISVAVLSMVAIIINSLKVVVNAVNYSFSIILLYDFLMRTLPCVLLVLYVTKFYNKHRASILCVVAFGLLAIRDIISIILSSSRFSLDLIVSLLVPIVFVLLAITTLVGISKKTYLAIVILIYNLLNVFSIIFLYSYQYQDRYVYWDSDFYITMATSVLSQLGNLILCIAVFLLVLKIKLPAVISLPSKVEKRFTEKMSSKQLLSLLQEKLETGAITEEEYQKQRAEIISKL